MGFFLIPGRIRLSYLIRQQLPDATLTRLIRPTGQCQTRRPDKAFTPHPAFHSITW
ncbi:hypothetical protein HMPREF1622_02587 [Escherichia coli A35218R]|nr:hypothetical protein HMPREF1622_02587 [Escherichia coli A35218R]